MTDQDTEQTDTTTEQDIDSTSEQEDSKKSEQEDTQDSKSEQETTDSKAEQEKEAKVESSAMGTIRKVQEMLEKGESVPKDMEWAVAQVDTSKIIQEKPEETEEQKFERFYQDRKDKEDYGSSVTALDLEYGDKAAEIKEKIEALKTKHGATMTHMEAYDLVVAGLGESEQSKLQARVRNQTFSPPRHDLVAETEKRQDINDIRQAMKEESGLNVSDEEFAAAKKLGLL